MKKRSMLAVLAGTIVLTSTSQLFGGQTATPPADETPWPTKGHPPHLDRKGVGPVRLSSSREGQNLHKRHGRTP